MYRLSQNPRYSGGSASYRRVSAEGVILCRDRCISGFVSRKTFRRSRLPSLRSTHRRFSTTASLPSSACCLGVQRVLRGIGQLGPDPAVHAVLCFEEFEPSPGSRSTMALPAIASSCRQPRVHYAAPNADAVSVPFPAIVSEFVGVLRYCGSGRNLLGCVASALSADDVRRPFFGPTSAP